MQGNAGECKGNVRWWVLRAREMQGNAGECRGVAGKCMGVRKVPGECRGMTGESTGVGVKC